MKGHLLGHEQLSYNDLNCIKLRLGEKKVYNFFITSIDRVLPLLTDDNMTALEAEKIVDSFEDFENCRHYFDIILKPLIKKRELLSTGKDLNHPSIKMVNQQLMNA